MTIPSALIGLALLLVATVAFALCVRRPRTRVRPAVPGEVVEAGRLGAERLGDRATLLQFSAESGKRCADAHRTLASVADSEDGVLHVDVDLTGRPDLARQFRVLQTPTTLILDRDGVVQTRFGGVPSRDVVELELTRMAAGS
ncbi:MAG: thioredoxin family protein [Microbacterium sp.]|uniref:TlpA family protein disulfide reductase n=1 Tax=Microbacterium sp. TaxID=51671 RepID=UPI0039E44802